MAYIPDSLEEFLDFFTETELFNLANTISNGFLKNKLESKQEAIQAIKRYSPDERSLLWRKAITKEILFRYLDSKYIPVSLPATKNDLVVKILDYWKASDKNNGHTFDQHPQDYSDTGNYSQSDLQVGKQENPDVNTMAFAFTEWFYSILNKNVCMGPEHFWGDAKLKLSLTSNEECFSEEVNSSPLDIVRMLFQTKSKYSLYFNPNLTTEGVQGRMDPHGLVLVLTCGTLIVDGVCAGVFEQVFALARDPFSDNNWKIKNTELNLRSRNDITSLPTLNENPLTGNLLPLPDRKSVV